MATNEQALAGKVVLVTGAGRGIGREIALASAAAGAAVVVNDLGGALDGGTSTETPAQEVVNEIKAAGGQAVADGNSVAEPGAAEAIVRTAMDAFGRLDLVVNNAGILRDRMFWKMSFADFDAVVKVHLYGSFNVSRAAAQVFKEQGSGAFVHITSTAGLVGNLGQANYAAAKLGIVGLSRSIATDMARAGIRSNCIAPFAMTRMVASIPGADSPEFQQATKEMTAGRIAPFVVFLGSDAGREVTGQIFAVRGNEISIMSQSRPIRTLHDARGWTQETLANRFLPTIRPHLYTLETTNEVFAGDTI
ncbi:SDR family NAD(P)-dependent oxidoreductase [Zavarzinia sp. CC-PAN008]|uniref:SDR family NAD(P)-dependent oxidoreductase n=1 Tax=Zavarzinia sp. CC-PAN008 TaxID=3243332 RepID=UPI003F74733D